jgi:cytochrome c-type biogenesis protein CcmH
VIRALVIALLVLAAAPAAASAAQPRTTLPDVEDEVMCVECGTVLSVSNSPVAQQERAFIRAQIAQGKDKDEIKDALVGEYGEGVLATPDASGFNATLWIVPILIVLLGAGGVLFALRNWRSAERAAEPAPPPPLSAADARRLNEELER